MPVISIENLSKSYRISHGAVRDKYETIRDTLAAAATWPLRKLRGKANGSVEEFWALKEVNLEIEQGEVVGFIGRNGAGKSTLLKILSRITPPTTGEIRLHGRVGSLLEVGTGFHPELTGRENIYLNGSILGMSRREIQSKFDEIVDFSGVEQFLDTPVKRYSSGMYVRLAFAVAANLEPEILLVDEVLAVGDAAFQEKCLGKMREVGKSGATVIFVSHNMATIQALCTRCVLVDRGGIRASGNCLEITSQYQHMNSAATGSRVDLIDHPGRSRKSSPLMTEAQILDQNGTETGCLPLRPTITVTARYQTTNLLRPVLGLVIKTGIGAPVFTVNNKFIPGYRFSPQKGAGSISCTMADLPLLPGRYYVDLYLANEHEDLDVVTDALSFEIVPGDLFGSGKLPPPSEGPVLWMATFSASSQT